MNKLQDKIESLSPDDREFLDSVGLDGVLRIFMSTPEIKAANRLVKQGVLERGRLPKRDSLTQFYTYFYIDSTIYSKL
jgi:hypothetical protein